MNNDRLIRIGRSALCLGVLVLGSAACSSGSQSVSTSKFVDSLTSACRTAHRSADDLDVTDPAGYLKDALKIVGSEADDVSSLKAPAADASDFDDFTSNLDDEQSALRKFADAYDGTDSASVDGAIAKLTKLVSTNDDLAATLMVSRCAHVLDAGDFARFAAGTSTDPSSSGSAGGETTTTPPHAPSTAGAPETTEPAPPDTPLPISTIPPSPATTAPVATMPPNTEVDMTTPGAGAGPASSDLSDYQPPAGYVWNPVDPPLSTVFPSPTSNAALGPVLVSYGVEGATPTDGSASVIIVVLEINTSFAEPTIDADLSFEGLSNGTVITTPGGHQAALLAGASTGETFDSIITFLDKQSVTIHVPVGGDPAAVLDAFLTANGA
ncbi:MAG: hypothetical protein JWM34_3939 [Ilumatobacteraceae bacterium]|nr:hypothetical protein [Ilumatobacteraceae bacterium]